MVELRAITEENFLDAFNLKLAEGQERFVSHPIRKHGGICDGDL